MLEKAYIIVNELLGTISVRAQEEKRRAVEKTSVLENTLVILNEVLVEIWMIKVTDEVSDRNEENVIGNQKAVIMAELCLCSSILWKIELVSNEV